jgi:hypothetical protein
MHFLHLTKFVIKTVSDSDTKIVIALATLGNTTRNRNNPICVTGGQGKFCFVSLALVFSPIHCLWKHGLNNLNNSQQWKGKYFCDA